MYTTVKERKPIKLPTKTSKKHRKKQNLSREQIQKHGKWKSQWN